MYHTVKKGETLAGIARAHSVPLSVLLAFNKAIQHPDNIFIGQLIYVPNLEDVPAGAVIAKPQLASKLVARARSAINQGIRYKLGEGGTRPTAALPASGNWCDCSGFVCWVLGLARQTKLPFYKKYGGWIYTDSMVADVNSQAGIFEKLAIPEVGCIVVYGAGAAIGHVGLVSDVENGHMKQVIHCSSGNDAHFNDAIQETGPAVFDRADALWGKFTTLA